jgi:hypothetical protein
MITLIRPIIFAFLASDAVKQLVVDLLSAYAERTDNKVDDYAVNLIKQELFDEQKSD